jgi:hypothetical protein
MAGSYRRTERDDVRRPIRDEIARRLADGRLLPEQAERLAAAEQRGHERIAAATEIFRIVGAAILVGLLALGFLMVVARAGAEPVDRGACRWCPDLQCLSSSVCGGCSCMKTGSGPWGRCVSVEEPTR